jgi:alkylation response protein AidB-like acyl-CoA dehydrogenase
MDFGFTPEQEAFRLEVRQWIKENLPPDWDGGESYFDVEDPLERSKELYQFGRQIAKQLGEKGWLAAAWPKEYGGLALSPVEQLIYKEEMTYHRVPGIDVGMGGITWIGPALMILGTEQQKKEHLPLIAKGERWWCTGYSEPEAGSDMASVRCRAVAHGDEYIVNGQKLWTSGGYHADSWQWLLVRTGPQEPKHKGISLLMVDLNTPGVTVRPLISAGGSHDFNEVFYDDVHVPRGNLVGEENRGWYHIMISLDFERTAGVSMMAGARRTLDDLTGFIKEAKINGEPLSKNRLVRHKLAELAIECEVGRMLAYRIIWMQTKGLIPNYEASMIKLFASEAIQRFVNVGTQIMGLYGQLGVGSKWASLDGRLGSAYVSSPGGTIAGGTSEVMRQIIGTRGLGLPR